MHRRWNALRRRQRAAFAIAAGAAILAMSAAPPLRAQSWPTKTVRIIVPFSAGSATDLFRAPCSSTCGKARADIPGRKSAGRRRRPSGSAPSPRRIPTATRSWSTPMRWSPRRQSRAMPYDPVQDFPDHAARQRAVGAGDSPDKNIKTLQGPRRQGEGKAGSLNYAAAGIGTPPHLTMERFASPPVSRGSWFRSAARRKR